MSPIPSLPLIAEPQQLSAILDHPDLLLIDLCRAETFASTHLPGAIHVEPGELVSGIRPATGKLPDIDRLNDLFSRIGYDAKKHIVAYDDEGGGWAGRFIWTLDVIGHAHSSYLNGGIHAWHGEGLPLTAEVTEPAHVELEVTIHPGPIAEMGDVLASIDDPGTVIWDARSAEEYAGIKVVAKRGGHVPGAINLDWLETMDRDRQLRIREDIGDVITTLGIAGKNVITHCQTHHRSGLTYLIGKSLGLSIRAYHGSWSEWGNSDTTPIER
jgi:thiosulfate/3-mercaptopyruvate sulfurtransferase